MAAPRSTGDQGTQKHPRLLQVRNGSRNPSAPQGSGAGAPHEGLGGCSASGGQRIFVQRLFPTLPSDAQPAQMNIRDQNHPQGTLKCQEPAHTGLCTAMEMS